MSCVTLDYAVISRFALWSGLYAKLICNYINCNGLFVIAFVCKLNFCVLSLLLMVLFAYTVAPYDVIITGDNTYPHGSQLKLHCLSEGGLQLGYSWSSPNLSYSTTNSLTVSNVTTLDGGNYTCTVTNDAGSSSNTVTVYSEFVHITQMSILLCVCVSVCYTYMHVAYTSPDNQKIQACFQLSY